MTEARLIRADAVAPFTTSQIQMGSTGFAGPTAVTGSFGVTGPATVTGSLGVTGATTVTGSMGVVGPMNVTGNTIMTGNTNITGNVGIGGSLSTAGGMSIDGEVVNVVFESNPFGAAPLTVPIRLRHCGSFVILSIPETLNAGTLDSVFYSTGGLPARYRPIGMNVLYTLTMQTFSNSFGRIQIGSDGSIQISSGAPGGPTFQPGPRLGFFSSTVMYEVAVV